MLNCPLIPGAIVEISTSAIDIETINQDNPLIAAHLDTIERRALQNVFHTLQHNKVKSDRILIVLKSESPDNPEKVAIVKVR